MTKYKQGLVLAMAEMHAESTGKTLAQAFDKMARMLGYHDPMTVWVDGELVSCTYDDGLPEGLDNTSDLR